MIEELERARPKFLVFVNVDTSWLISADSERVLSRWFARHWRDFERVGVVEFGPGSPSRFYWDDAARGRERASPLWLGVYRRRGATETNAGEHGR